MSSAESEVFININVTSTPSPPEATALHEAGHAVANVLLGWDVTEVSIVKNSATSRNGYCNANPKPDKCYNWEDRITVYFAGPVGESLHNGDVWDVGIGQDIESAQLCAEPILKGSGEWEEEPAAKHILLGDGTVYGATSEEESKEIRAEEIRSQREYDAWIQAKRDAILNPLWGRTVALVGQHESAIRAVAAALLIEQTLSGQQVESIMSTFAPE